MSDDSLDDNVMAFCDSSNQPLEEDEQEVTLNISNDIGEDVFLHGSPRPVRYTNHVYQEDENDFIDAKSINNLNNGIRQDKSSAVQQSKILPSTGNEQLNDLFIINRHELESTDI